jgi:tetratricopeptide (TPR) repeat protein
MMQQRFIVCFYALFAAMGLFWLAGCSQYSEGRVSKGYHNLTAHFNAYVIARDEMQVVEKALFKNRDDNYNRPLPVLLPIDSAKAQPVKAYLDDIIKMGSIVAERHQNSKWLDDSYLLLGKARLYKQDFPNAIEVFKYVNTKGTDDDAKHAALVQLMHAYAEQNDFSNGLNVAEYLRVQPLNEANTRDFYLTKAYLHQRKEESLIAASILDAVFPLLKKGEETARLHLIAGQQYDLANQPAKAAEHYGQVLKNRPSYDQSFYASLFLIQSADPKVVARSGVSFEKMLDDRKNTDLKDKIYYTMGQLEARRGRIDPALKLYQQSVTATTKNTEQVPYTYLEMAKLYFEKKQNYEAAKAYYDSALALLPPKSADFTAVSTRKKTLDEFVQHLTTIRTEDSLQRLTKLSAADLDKVLDKELARREKEDAKQAEIARQVIEKATGTPTTAGLSMPGATNSDLNPAERWVLYNPVQLSQAKQEFQQKWGNRPLEDDWRRSTKETALAQTGAGPTASSPGATSASSPDWYAGWPESTNKRNAKSGYDCHLTNKTRSLVGLEPTARRRVLSAR